MVFVFDWDSFFTFKCEEFIKKFFRCFVDLYFFFYISGVYFVCNIYCVFLYVIEKFCCINDFCCDWFSIKFYS